MKKHLSKVINNAKVLLFGNSGATLLGALSLSIMTKTLGVELFGVYILIFVYVEIIDKVFNFQTWQTFIKFCNHYNTNSRKNIPQLLQQLIAIDILSLCLAYTIAIVSSDAFISFMDIDEAHADYIMLMSAAILFKVAELSIGIFRFFDHFKVQVSITLLIAFCKLVLFICVSLFSPSIMNFIVAHLASEAFGMVLKIIFSLKILLKNNVHINEILSIKIGIPAIREKKLISFAAYNNLDNAVRMVSRQFDIVLLGKLYSTEIVGIYKVAVTVSNLASKLSDALYQSLYPELAKLIFHNQRKVALELAIKISKIVTTVGITVYILFYLWGDYFIVLLFGEQFLQAADISLIYLLAILLAISSLPIFPMQLSFGLAKQSFINQISATAAYIPIAYALIINYEMEGAAIAYIFYYIILITLTFISIKKEFT